jgi:predicted tellurium resistance membrane protein TerC
MDFFSSPDLWIAFLTLFALEIVLGIDNVVFIAILSDKLPPEQRRKARLLGLSLAMIFRIALLFAASWVAGLTAPLFQIGSWDALEVSGRDLILLVGGAFLIYKAVEIHARLEGHEAQREAGRVASFTDELASVSDK